MDRRYVLTGLGYAVLGLILGIYMAASKNHGQLVTHAHIMLLGFVVSFVYGLCHKLWLNNSDTRLSMIQYYLHQAGTFVLIVSLFLLYGRYLKPEILDPILGFSSVIVLISLIMMKILFIRSGKSVV